jgi:exodeoxyribonuclease VII large subunit
MQKPITVTTLNNQIKSLLETHYMQISVIGEVSRVTYHSSGHLYFSLKDENSTISCVMFKGNNQRLKFRVQEGMEVIVSGGISVYTPRGSYQINCSNLEPSGVGALSLAYEQLKEKLKKKGYFEKERKKALPKFPQKIILVTSKTGAAIEDMKRVAKKRWELVELILIDTTVQGEDAPMMIANNIKLADSLGADIIVVGRGGGSLEDLWAFNEEIVADAIYKAKTPIVSAVGHEIDVMISDFCADLRAPTPSAAMELILPDINEIRLYLDSLKEQFDTTLQNILQQKEQTILHLKQSFEQHSFEKRLDQAHYELKSIYESLNRSILLHLSQKERMLNDLKVAYESNNPKNRDRVGFAQILKDGKKVDLSDLKVDDTISILNSKVKLKATITHRKNLS